MVCKAFKIRKKAIASLEKKTNDEWKNVGRYYFDKGGLCNLGPPAVNVKIGNLDLFKLG